MAIITLNNNSLSSVTALPAGVGGKVLQVVHSSYDTYVTTTSTSYITSNVTALITPSSTSSKILVLTNLLGVGADQATACARYKLVRNDTTDIKEFDDIAGYNGGTNSGPTQGYTSHFNYLDSPSATTQTRYRIYWKKALGTTVYINNYANSNNITTSTMTLMEIAG